MSNDPKTSLSIDQEARRKPRAGRLVTGSAKAQSACGTTDDKPEEAGLADTNALPSARSTRSIYLKREPLTEAKLAELRAHAERTGIGAMLLLRGARDKPAGLNAYIVSTWINYSAQSAVPVHVEYALARWAGLPTNRRIAFTDEMRSTLAAEFTRTGSGPVQILKRANDVPAGLAHPIIQSWKSGRPKPATIGEAHWNYVMARLHALPNARAISATDSIQADRQLTVIAAEDLAELRHHRQRTGIGGAILLRGATDKPTGLTPAMISGWLSGAIQKARPQFVAYVIARYRTWP
jgi:hypothetical protein